MSDLTGMKKPAFSSTAYILMVVVGGVGTAHHNPV